MSSSDTTFKPAITIPLVQILKEKINEARVATNIKARDTSIELLEVLDNGIASAAIVNATGVLPALGSFHDHPDICIRSKVNELTVKYRKWLNNSENHHATAQSEQSDDTKVGGVIGSFTTLSSLLSPALPEVAAAAQQVADSLESREDERQMKALEVYLDVCLENDIDRFHIIDNKVLLPYLAILQAFPGLTFRPKATQLFAKWLQTVCAYGGPEISAPNNQPYGCRATLPEALICKFDAQAEFVTMMDKICMPLFSNAVPNGSKIREAGEIVDLFSVITEIGGEGLGSGLARTFLWRIKSFLNHSYKTPRRKCTSLVEAWRSWNSTKDCHGCFEACLMPLKYMRDNLRRSENRWLVKVEEKNDRINELLSQNEGMIAQAVKSRESYLELKANLSLTQDELNKERVDLKKQKAKHYQDVEKRVKETTSSLRSQLTTASLEAALHKKTITERDDLLKEVARLKKENQRLIQCKAESDGSRYAAAEEARVIREGYEQIKTNHEQLETAMIELQADFEQITQDRDDLHQQVTSLKKAQDTATTSASKRTHIHQQYATTTHNPAPIDRYTRDLDHLDGTIAF
ncbi:hypothetical protein BKA63DRAFT_116432 [Paraphoma chrysanthemicola]|nr:hypothetical protein BKA63DRAFT_116432 [Paraphoma chrysanthemicola]